MPYATAAPATGAWVATSTTRPVSRPAGADERWDTRKWSLTDAAAVLASTRRNVAFPARRGTSASNRPSVPARTTTGTTPPSMRTEAPANVSPCTGALARSVLDGTVTVRSRWRPGRQPDATATTTTA